MGAFETRVTELPTYTRGTDLGAWWDLHLAGVVCWKVTCGRPNSGDGGCMQPMREGGVRCSRVAVESGKQWRSEGVSTTSKLQGRMWMGG